MRVLFASVRWRCRWPPNGTAVWSHSNAPPSQDGCAAVSVEPVILAIALLVVGLVVLSLAADHLVIGASAVAHRLRIAPVVVGVVVIGLGTSAPELLVSSLASARGDGGLALGNLIGSNVLNVTLILAVSALVRPLAVHSRVVVREAPLTIISMVVFATAVVTGLGAAWGIVLAVLTIVALGLLIRLGRTGALDVLAPEVDEFVGRRSLVVEIGRTMAGLGGVLIASQLLVVNAESVATRLGVSQVVIGFTVVALGTSLPELVTAVQAQRRGESDLLVGNVLGSNMFNSLAGGAVVGLASPYAYRSTWPLVAGMLVTGLLAWALLFRDRRLTRTDGTVLLIAYALMLPLLV